MLIMDAHEPKLVRTLSLLDITMIGIAAMIGGSIFVLIGTAIGFAGPAVIIAFLLNAIITTFTAMSYAELGSSIPEVGGGYRWIREGLPRPMHFINGWLGWFAHIVATSLYAISFGTFMQGLLHTIGVNYTYADKLFATLAILALAYVNYRGASPTGRIGNIITFVQLGVICIFIISGLVVMHTKPDWIINFADFAPFGIYGILAAMMLTFIAFEGYEVIVQAGEEAKNPRKDIPKAIFISIIAVTIIYIAIAVIAIGATQAEEDGASWKFIGSYGELGIIKSADTFIPFGAYLVLFGGMVSMLAALNASMFSSSRVAVAMGRYYNLPHILSKIHARNRTPYIAIAVSSSIMLLMIYIFPLQEIAIAAGLIFLILFSQVNAAAINIRKVYGNRLTYGFKTPLFPIVPIIGMLLTIGLALYIIVTQPMSLVVTIVWVAIGLIMYKMYSFKQEVEHLAPLLAARGDVIRKDFRILVPYIPEDPIRLIRYAINIAKSTDGEINVLRVITVPYQVPLSTGVAFVDDAVRSFEPTRRILEDSNTVYHYLIRISHDSIDALLASIEEQKIDLLVYDFDIFKNSKRLQLLLTCDTIALKVSDESNAKRVLAFYDDEGVHSKLVIKLLGWLRDAQKTVVYPSRLEGIDYVNEKDKLHAYGCDVVEVKPSDKIDKEWLVDLILRSVKEHEPELIVLPASILGINILNNVYILRALESIDCNMIVAKSFTIPAIHKAKLLFRKILYR
jgi:amino acid transporter